MERRIGKGGMGAVYIARHTRFNKRVAIKVLLPDVKNDPSLPDRFQQEAEASARIKHPNIVPVNDFGQTEDSLLYMVMEYVEGLPLRQLLETEKKLAPKRVVDLGGQICAAIAVAHRAGIIHRDLKPENVMVELIDDREIARVLDFGIAKLKDDHRRITKEGSVLGTPLYMSPEQCNGGEVDRRSDIYSLGVMLYELLSGHVPFNAPTWQAIMIRHIAEPPRPLAEVCPGVPAPLARAVMRALEKDPAQRQQTAIDLANELRASLETSRADGTIRVMGPQGAYSGRSGPDAIEEAEPVSADTEAVTTESKRARIFISYKRNAEPDQSVAAEIFEALKQHHDVFIDQAMPLGTRWARHIETELRQADYLIALLSAQSVHSEMVQAEIEMVHLLANEQAGRPAILPVRLAYREPFQYPLSAYLNPINWAYWGGAEDTPRIIEELRRAVLGGKLVIDDVQSKENVITLKPTSDMPAPLPSAQLEMPEGTMDSQSTFYVVRKSDPVALEAIKRQGVTITIKGPRQMGKSSLLIRAIDAAVTAGKRVAFLDFQLIDRTSLTNAELFYRHFCAWLTSELEMEDRVAEYWGMPLGNSLRCTRYVSKYLLKEMGGPLVLAMDEVESVFDTEFRSDFFGMLRNWHNDRSRPPFIWKQLDLVLVTSTEPYQLIENLNQSPFNVGEVIELTDFTAGQVADLNRRHGSPLDPNEVQRLMALLGGHPYLIRRALYLVASQRVSAAELFESATADRGPFGDHLRYHLFRLHNKEELIEGLRQVIRKNTCDDEQIFFRLRGAGLVRSDGRAALPRCQLYADYFREHLDV
ncbi:MAG TPA: AAA-like domain-containing protein [Blastocatellia bacterium]|nr:AAA-like domain-containing protein [Blastocatellia bacterium]